MCTKKGKGEQTSNFVFIDLPVGVDPDAVKKEKQAVKESHTALENINLHVTEVALPEPRLKIFGRVVIK
jgi:hypothetical protein